MTLGRSCFLIVLAVFCRWINLDMAAFAEDQAGNVEMISHEESVLGIDPFRPYFKVHQEAVPIFEASMPLHLEGVMWGGKKASAIINGQIVHEGDSMGGYSVSQILKDRVVLEHGNKKLDLFQKGSESNESNL